MDPVSGHLYYSPAQLADARVIDALRQASVPLADIRAFMRQPSQERLDAWEKQLHTNASHRQSALTLARQLSAVSQDPRFPLVHPDSKEEFMITLRTAGRSDIGHVRENNEDAIVTNDRLASRRWNGRTSRRRDRSECAAGLIPAVFTGRSADELEAALGGANWAIRDQAHAQPGLDGMGTTVCVAGLLTDGHLAVVNVGDSRAYLWHDDALTQLTQDHSVLRPSSSSVANYERRMQLSTPITGFSPELWAWGLMSRSTAEPWPSRQEIESSFVPTAYSTSSPTRRSRTPWRQAETAPTSLTT